MNPRFPVAVAKSPAPGRMPGRTGWTPRVFGTDNAALRKRLFTNSVGFPVTEAGGFTDSSRGLSGATSPVNTPERLPSRRDGRPGKGRKFSLRALWHPSGMRRLLGIHSGGVAALNHRLISVFPPGKGSAERMQGPWPAADSVPNTLGWKPVLPGNSAGMGLRWHRPTGKRRGNHVISCQETPGNAAAGAARHPGASGKTSAAFPTVPGAPGNTPAAPAAAPGDPGNTSAAPAAVPGGPGNAPAAPAAVPNASRNTSAAPATIPGAPGNTSAAPAAAPGDPGNTSAAPVTAPGDAVIPSSSLPSLPSVQPPAAPAPPLS